MNKRKILQGSTSSMHLGGVSLVLTSYVRGSTMYLGKGSGVSLVLTNQSEEKAAW